MIEKQRTEDMVTGGGGGRERRARVERRTKETQIELEIGLDGAGSGAGQPPSAPTISTGVGFFNHMLDALARHGRFDLRVVAEGDLHIDAHHLVEDVGIALGTAFREALGGDLLVQRFATAHAPLDESLARAVVDLSGRSWLSFGVDIGRERVGDFDTELVREFFQAFVSNARLCLHVDLLRGENAHHQIEACFKAVAIALREAVARDADLREVPSTKGSLREEDARGAGGGES